MGLFELKTEIPVDSVEALDSVLLEHGVENWSLLEDVIVKRAWLVGVFETEEAARAAWAVLVPLLPAKPVSESQVRAMPDEDWRDSYKAHFKPWRFGRLHWVPVWLRDTYELPKGEAVIWLDPGLAFGTGNHETTRLCVERLVQLTDRVDPSVARVADAGCGSGILALSAIRLGFKDVVGFDNDPEAVRVSQENATLNELAGRVRFSTADLVTGLQPGCAEIVLANIQADILMRFAPQLLSAVSPGGILVMSGILAIELDQVRSTFAGQAPQWPSESKTMGEWSDLMLVRPRAP